MDLQTLIAPPSGSLNRHLDPAPGRGTKVPERRGGPMTKCSARARGEQRGPQPPLPIEMRMPDRIDPPPHEVQLAAAQAPIDRRAAQPEGDQLRPADHTALHPGPPSNKRRRGWVHLAPHSGVNCLHPPSVTKKSRRNSTTQPQDRPVSPPS